MNKTFETIHEHNENSRKKKTHSLCLYFPEIARSFAFLALKLAGGPHPLFRFPTSEQPLENLPLRHHACECHCPRRNWSSHRSTETSLQYNRLTLSASHKAEKKVNEKSIIQLLPCFSPKTKESLTWNMLKSRRSQN